MESIVASGENQNTINYVSYTYLPGNKYLEVSNEKIQLTPAEVDYTYLNEAIS